MIKVGSIVVVTKGKKVPVGTTGMVFWLRRYDCKNGIFGYTRIGIKTCNSEVFFLPADYTKELKG